MKLSGDPTLEQAEALLMIPDLFNFWFTGIKVCEFSDATTTQFYDPRQRTWARPLLEKLGLPTGMLQEIVQPGTVIGPLRPEFAEDTGLDGAPVIAPACHDTGSAVAAVPARGKGFAYISSGTWSLMGVETTEPVISQDSLAFNFTNEGGVCGTFRLLKNIMGLWLVQECKRQWQREGQDLSYGELTKLAAAAKPFFGHVECDRSEFLAPGDMPSRINKYLSETGQKPTQDKGQMVRLVLESLALKYRSVLNAIEDVTGRAIDVLHCVGGGIQNELLCQFTANAIGRKAVTGPIEATASGNILMQAKAAGQIKSIDEAREVIRNSFDLKEYQPQDTGLWDKQYKTFAGSR
jgi:rhamnulokinase